MKRLLCLLLALLFSITLCACNEENIQESIVPESSKEESEKEELPYYFFVFNSRQLSSKDKEAIACIKAMHNGVEIVDFDVCDIKVASEIYVLLKTEHERRGGTLKGIQIFGDSRAVPAFSLGYKIALKGKIENGEDFLSDYFLCNFNNELSDLESFNLYDCFENGKEIDFYPQWCVARLPLTRGKYSAYLENYREYQAEKQDNLTVAVSSPIFQSGWYPVPIDDIGYFLQRARDEWELLKEMKLYSNTEGLFPSALELDGSLRAEEWTAESKERVCEYYIYGHAGEAAMLQTVYTSKSEYECRQIINYSNINTYLCEKPYFIFAGGCNTAKNMRENIIQIALHGKCIGAFASTSLISNVDIDCMADEEVMQSGYTYHSLIYGYLKAQANGKSRAEAFLAGQQAMADSLAENCAHLESYQYHNNYHNLLALHNFGIIDQ